MLDCPLHSCARGPRKMRAGVGIVFLLACRCPGRHAQPNMCMASVVAGYCVRWTCLLPVAHVPKILGKNW